MVQVTLRAFSDQALGKKNYTFCDISVTIIIERDWELRKISSNKINSKLAKKKKKDKARREKSKQQKDLDKKNQKLMNEKLTSIEKLIDRFPKSCSSCDAVLDKKDDEHLDKWKLTFDNGKMSMLCESCQV